MATYLSLEEAAKKLGIPTQSLIDLRSQGQVRGFRDGSSWKFPETEIARLADELPNLSGFGSGILGADGPGSKVGKVIGGDGSSVDPSDISLDADGSGGSSIDLGMEGSGSGSDSDVNLVAGDGSGGSDVLIIPGGTGGSSIGSGSGSSLPLDLDELDIAGSAVSHDSGELSLSPEDAGKEKAASKPAASSQDSDEFNLGSVLDLEADDDSPLLDISEESDELSLKDVAEGSDEISGLDLASGSGDALAGSDAKMDLDLVSNDENASSLEMMEDLDLKDSASGITGGNKVSGDVLSELDLLAGDSVGSGLLSGDSENLLGSSLLSSEEGGSSGVDDALADDDDLVISDDDDDLIVSSAGSDISIAGDSGINLMSPSDSGLSLESEPLDLAGSSISALDLGAELAEGSGSGSGGSDYGSGLIPDDGSGANMDFPSDEEFQLSPSGIQLEGSDESESQEIDVENSDSFGSGGFDEPAFVEEPIAEEAPVFEEGQADVFGGVEAIEEGAEPVEEPFTPDESSYEQSAAAPVGASVAYEIPFTLLQTVGLMLILMVMSLGGMLMTDLIRNMWSYTEPAAPVSSLTDMLIDVAGWGK